MGNGEVTFPQSKANLGPIILNVDWVLFTLSTTIVILRLGTRVWITRNPGWDDAAIALAQVNLSTSVKRARGRVWRH